MPVDCLYDLLFSSSILHHVIMSPCNAMQCNPFIHSFIPTCSLDYSSALIQAFIESLSRQMISLFSLEKRERESGSGSGSEKRKRVGARCGCTCTSTTMPQPMKVLIPPVLHHTNKVSHSCVCLRCKVMDSICVKLVTGLCGLTNTAVRPGLLCVRVRVRVASFY